MDLSSISTLVAGAGRGKVAPDGPTGAATDAVAGFAQALNDAETQARAAVTTGTDPHSLVTALAESKLAIDTVVTVRDRVVEAYQEILRMPV